MFSFKKAVHLEMYKSTWFLEVLIKQWVDLDYLANFLALRLTNLEKTPKKGEPYIDPPFVQTFQICPVLYFYLIWSIAAKLQFWNWVVSWDFSEFTMSRFIIMSHPQNRMWLTQPILPTQPLFDIY